MATTEGVGFVPEPKSFSMATQIRDVDSKNPGADERRTVNSNNEPHEGGSIVRPFRTPVEYLTISPLEAKDELAAKQDQKGYDAKVPHTYEELSAMYVPSCIGSTVDIGTLFPNVASIHTKEAGSWISVGLARGDLAFAKVLEYVENMNSNQAAEILSAMPDQEMAGALFSEIAAKDTRKGAEIVCALKDISISRGDGLLNSVKVLRNNTSSVPLLHIMEQMRELDPELHQAMLEY